MRHIHPFPARMAPDIALTKIRELSVGKTVLDPMCGSGMVLSQASKNGLQSIGYDLDPLARLISRVGSTRVVEKTAENALEKLIEACHSNDQLPALSWIDDDEETLAFVRFWYCRKQENQLRVLSHFLMNEPVTKNVKVLNLLKVVVSRLIITKEPKASRARDTAHSRPHRTIVENEFDIFGELRRSFKHVMQALDPSEIGSDSRTYLGDARNMTRIDTKSIDAIITSPPYLNAIDYMRGHRLSLIWWGHSLADLRHIRSITIGAERALATNFDDAFIEIAKNLGFEKLENKTYKMLWRYYTDLCCQTQESARVLKRKGSAMYVIGNSNLRGQHIQNSELLKSAAEIAGLNIVSESTREIPDNRRYLPMAVHSKNALSTRMRTEHIIEFLKA